jgi:hypothetical protein
MEKKENEKKQKVSFVHWLQNDFAFCLHSFVDSLSSHTQTLTLLPTTSTWNRCIESFIAMCMS